jgi:Alpha-lytic protease prodomain
MLWLPWAARVELYIGRASPTGEDRNTGLGPEIGVSRRPPRRQRRPPTPTCPGWPPRCPRLITRTAGSYKDGGKPIVTVTVSAAARSVGAAGAVPRLVTRSGADLARATAQLQRTASIPGTAWMVDPATNQVVVSADRTVTGGKLAQLTGVVERLGGAVRLERLAGTLSTRIAGGDAIYGGGLRCSLGFNVHRPGAVGAYFLTAGHCANAAATWSGPGGQVLGNRVGSSFPDNDYALIQYTTNVSRPGTVNRPDPDHGVRAERRQRWCAVRLQHRARADVRR